MFLLKAISQKPRVRSFFYLEWYLWYDSLRRLLRQVSRFEKTNDNLATITAKLPNVDAVNKEVRSIYSTPQALV